MQSLLSFSQILANPNVHISTYVATFLSNFQACHFKFFIGNTEDNSDNFHIQLAIIQYFQDKATFSTEELNNSSFVANRTSHEHHSRFTLCFIHSYMINHVEEYATLNQTIRDSEKTGDTPNYFVFYENSEIVNFNHKSYTLRKKFFSSTIASHFVMSPVFYIDSLKSVYIVCIPCRNGDRDPFVYLINAKMDTITKIWKTVYSDLQKIYVDPLWISAKIDLVQKLKCDRFVGGKSFTSSKNMKFTIDDLCVHQILSKKLNYAIIKPKYESKEIVPHGFATGLVFISTHNLHDAKVERRRWLTHGTQYYPLYILTTLKRPGLHTTVLLKPFKGSTWATILMCGLVLIIITKVTYIHFEYVFKYGVVDKFYNFKNIGIWNIVIAMVANILDQAITNIVSRYSMLRFYPFKVLSSTWFLWFIAMLHVGMLYRSVIYSFITKQIDPLSPETLDELVAMPVKLITLSRQIETNTSQHTAVSLLKESVLKVPDNPNFPLIDAYNKVAQSTQFYNETFLSFALKMYKNFIGNASNSSEKVPFTNIALIDFFHSINLELIMSSLYFPNNVVLKPKPFPGYLLIKPWLVRNNYFLPIFHNYLARLYESGIEAKTKSFVLSVQHYNRMRDISVHIKNISVAGTLMPTNGKLYFMSVHESVFTNRHVTDSYTPISIETLKIVFFLFSCNCCSGIFI